MKSAILKAEQQTETTGVQITLYKLLLVDNHVALEFDYRFQPVSDSSDKELNDQ